ncbi:MAG: monovalent cation/H+ antiporter subunit D family protein, partial [Candidatus Eremiobacteraeota bacterium]|nr:monovalent cation/H+ antiporter subunit D family protein [Candidatus Eremiobacteraeota bacterium]
MLVLILCASLLALPGILVFRKAPNAREACTFLAGFVLLGLVCSQLDPVLRGLVPHQNLIELFPNLWLSLRLDGLGLLFALVASSLWLVTSAYSIGYMRGLDEHDQTRYYCFFAVAIAATMGVAMAGNLLTLYLFYELLTFSTFPLVTHHRDAEAVASGRKYLAYVLGGSVALVFPAMCAVYVNTGSLEFSALRLGGSDTFRSLVLLAFVFGFSKAAIMPVHSWLPNAMVAPTPVSSLLHAVAVVKVGVFSIIRVLTGIYGTDLLGLMGADRYLCAITATTVLTGALMMLTQDNLKRCLAFSTIGQLAYIVLGVATLQPSGITGGALHIAMHAFGKITLFFCAGAIYVASKKKNISQLDGIGRRMPWTMACFFIGSLSIVGVPPTAGFLSKWLILQGTLQAGLTGAAICILASSFLKACTLFPIVYRAYFRPVPEGSPEHGEAPLFCLVPPLITAAMSVALFFYPQP